MPIMVKLKKLSFRWYVTLFTVKTKLVRMYYGSHISPAIFTLLPLNGRSIYDNYSPSANETHRATPYNSPELFFFHLLDHTKQQYLIPTDIYFGSHHRNILGQTICSEPFSKWPPSLSKITFLSITLLIWQVEKRCWCLYLCFKVPGI